jgi:hypothetical protein
MGPFATRDEEGMVALLKEEKVDVVVACDLSSTHLVSFLLNCF